MVLVRCWRWWYEAASGGVVRVFALVFGALEVC